MVESSQNEIEKFIRIIMRKKWLILCCVVGILIPVTFVTFTASPVYRASAMLVCEETQAAVPELGIQRWNLNNTFVINQLQEINSWSFIEEVVRSVPERNLKTYPIPETLPPGFTLEELYVAMVKDNLSAEQLPKSDVIKVSVEAFDPETARVLTNAVAQVLKDRNLNVRMSEVRKVRETIEEQLEFYGKKIEETGLALKQFKEENSVTYLDKQAEEVFKRVTAAEVEFNRVQSQHRAAKERFDYLEHLLKQERADLVESVTTVTSPWAEELLKELTQLKVNATMLKVQNYKEDHPKVVELNQQIKEAERNLEKEMKKIAEGETTLDPLSQIQASLLEIKHLQVELQTLEATQAALNRVLQNYSATLQNLPAKEYQLAHLMREKTVADNVYSTLLQRREAAKITEAEKAENIRIIDPALTPRDPVKPKKKMNLAMGLLMGLFTGVGLAFLLEFMNKTIHNADDVEKYLEMELIGSIPKTREMIIKTSEDSDNGKEFSENTGLITHYDMKSPASETFRSLRTAVYSTLNNLQTMTLMVTSANPGEGKSLIAANLASVMAQLGDRTLLIDADLRKPRQHDLFQVDQRPGLVECLKEFSKTGSRSRSVKKPKFKTDLIHSTSILNLFLMASGAEIGNPSEALASHLMEALIEEFRKFFHVIIFDLPPVLPVTDAAIMARESNGIIFVIDSKKTKPIECQRAEKILKKVNANNILGAVLNKVDRQDGYYYSYYNDKKHSAHKKKPVADLDLNDGLGKRNLELNKVFLDRIHEGKFEEL